VLAHAISDALLGAACLGDIGQHFPPDDPRYKGADSIKLLARVRELVHQVEYRVAHVDSVVACQAPKLKPHIAAMRSRLAAALQLDERSVSVKATTTEGLGAIGRAEGIAAYATATLVPRL
jgi:2-C-methyl-D-erythritol 2,4-cyclodiphosphate synthase